MCGCCACKAALLCKTEEGDQIDGVQTTQCVILVDAPLSITWSRCAGSDVLCAWHPGSRVTNRFRIPPGHASARHRHPAIEIPSALGDRPCRTQGKWRPFTCRTEPLARLAPTDATKAIQADRCRCGLPDLTSLPADDSGELASSKAAETPASLAITESTRPDRIAPPALHRTAMPHSRFALQALQRLRKYVTVALRTSRLPRTFSPCGCNPGSDGTQMQSHRHSIEL